MAMKAGQLEAAVVLPPITTIAQREGMNVLLDMSGLGAEYQITGLASTQSFINNTPSAMKLMRSFVEGIHFYKTRKKESMAIIAKYMRTNDTWKQSERLMTTSPTTSFPRSPIRPLSDRTGNQGFA